MSDKESYSRETLALVHLIPTKIKSFLPQIIVFADSSPSVAFEKSLAIIPKRLPWFHFHLNKRALNPCTPRRFGGEKINLSSLASTRTRPLVLTWKHHRRGNRKMRPNPLRRILTDVIRKFWLRNENRVTPFIEQHPTSCLVQK